MYATVAIYDERSLEQTMIFEGHVGGVTQVKFVSNSNILFTGARKVCIIYFTIAIVS